MENKFSLIGHGACIDDWMTLLGQGGNGGCIQINAQVSGTGIKCEIPCGCIRVIETEKWDATKISMKNVRLGAVDTGERKKIPPWKKFVLGIDLDATHSPSSSDATEGVVDGSLTPPLSAALDSSDDKNEKENTWTLNNDDDTLTLSQKERLSVPRLSLTELRRRVGGVDNSEIPADSSDERITSQNSAPDSPRIFNGTRIRVDPLTRSRVGGRPIVMHHPPGKKAYLGNVFTPLFPNEFPAPPLDPRNLRILCQLSEGYFAAVFRGLYNGVPVAVKCPVYRLSSIEDIRMSRTRAIQERDMQGGAS
eukprot:GHVO01003919.1.p1 GENE.GHVO01003919.1~~GHVO01003919.1.p1  ORF type:complete len:307 (+),score=66.55 GHVO01003919.1:77-997(+)